MKTTELISIIVILAAMIIVGGCQENFLEEDPYGEISPDNMTEQQNIERAINAAYSVLNGQFDDASNAYNSPASNWSFGDAVSDDAYKGGGGTGDQNQIHQMEIFNTRPTIIDIERKWLALFEGVKRANNAMNLINKSKEYDSGLKTQRMAELRFLRGHYYFELKKIYNQIPYIDESAENVEDYSVSNTQYSSEEIWGFIEDNFSAALEVLPDNQEEPARPTKMAAQAYLAKVYLFQEKWEQAEKAATAVIESNKYSLENNFDDVFLPENDNGQEIVFAVQHSVNDGHPLNYNGDIGDRLQQPGGPFYPRYGFHRPSQDLINAYKTDDNGHPVPENGDLQSDDTVDPRLDYTVGRPDIPYLNLGIKYESSWARDLSTYGPYAPKKRVVSASHPLKLNSWPYTSALNYYIIRYADVLLWKAEAAIENGDIEEGRTYINMVRNRAKNGNYLQTLDNSGDAANYNIEPYNQPFGNYEEAIKSLKKERRLEFALEGHRFFDLVRWDIAAEVMNEYFNEEKQFRSHLTNASFEAGTHEYFPIPQSYIDLVGKEQVEQNPGY